jgi:aldose 1-epimerase
MFGTAMSFQTFPCLAAAFLTAASSFAQMTRTPFATTPDGQKVEAFTLTNKNGLRARVITWGATLVEMSVPDRKGVLADVTLGFDEPERYLGAHPFFGCIAGRYANRIALGKFTLDGTTYTLATNNGRNHLHGGPRGFDKRNWTAEPAGANAVRFTYVSADGEEGYPGTLTASVTYTLTDSDELSLKYTATTDKPTVINLTNHAYWNLAGEGNVLEHTLLLRADRYTVVDDGSIPTGELRAVAGTPMDFTKGKPIGKDIGQLKETPGGGYDHNWVLPADKSKGVIVAAEVHDAKSGRNMHVLTDQPGVQFYTGNYLNNVKGRGGRIYGKQSGFCLETQHYPDSPNRPDFPTTTLRPGETYQTTTIFRFPKAQ